jgi:hypothetical protein
LKINLKFSKKKIIASMICGLLFLSMSIIFLVQNSGTIFSDNSGKSLEFESIYYDSSSGLVGRTEQLITTQAQWEEIWVEVTSPFIPQPTILIVNFDNEMIVVVSTGSKPTTGYSIEVTDVKLENNNLVIYTTEMSSESQACGLFTMIIHPTEIIKLQRISFNEIIFKRNYQEC